MFVYGYTRKSNRPERAFRCCRANERAADWKDKTAYVRTRTPVSDQRKTVGWHDHRLLQGTQHFLNEKGSSKICSVRVQKVQHGFDWPRKMANHLFFSSNATQCSTKVVKKLNERDWNCVTNHKKISKTCSEKLSAQTKMEAAESTKCASIEAIVRFKCVHGCGSVDHFWFEWCELFTNHEHILRFLVSCGHTHTAN